MEWIKDRMWELVDGMWGKEEGEQSSSPSSRLPPCMLLSLRAGPGTNVLPWVIRRRSPVATWFSHSFSISRRK